MATLDLLSPDEARSAVQLARSDQRNANLLTAYTTAVSQRLDEMLGPVVLRTVTNERHDGGRYSLTPYENPVSAITSVTEYVGAAAVTLAAETAGTVPDPGYYFDVRTQTVWRRASGFDRQYAPGRGNVTLSYTAGRFADTASVAPRFKQCASIVLAHIWRQEEGGGTLTFGPGGEVVFSSWSVPRRAMELVADEVRVPGIA